MVARTRKTPITVYISEFRFAAGTGIERWDVLAAIEGNMGWGAEWTMSGIHHVMTGLLEPKTWEAVSISATWVASVSNQALRTARGQMHTQRTHDRHERPQSCRPVPPKKHWVSGS